MSASASFFSVDLSWLAGGLTAGQYFEIEYDTTGFTPGSGNVITVTDSSASISGLDTTTAYDFYITKTVLLLLVQQLCWANYCDNA